MSYEISLGKPGTSWKVAPALEYTIDFLVECYYVRIGERAVLLKSSGVASDEVAAVLILYYLIGYLRGGFHSRDEWISFRELQEGKVFWPAFLKNTIEPLAANLERDLKA